MSSKDILRNFYTGVWVAIFGLAGIPLALIWAGLLYVVGISDNPALLLILTLVYIFAAVTIVGWAARMGVKRVK